MVFYMLTGKTALITGGAKGIGRAIALKIAEAHGNVALVYRGSEKQAEETMKKVRASMKLDYLDK